MNKGVLIAVLRSDTVLHKNHTVPHHETTPYHTTPHYIKPHHTTPHHTTPHHTTPRPTTPHYTTLHYTTRHPTGPHHATLHYTTLYYPTSISDIHESTLPVLNIMQNQSYISSTYVQCGMRHTDNSVRT